MFGKIIKLEQGEQVSHVETDWRELSSCLIRYIDSARAALDNQRYEIAATILSKAANRYDSATTLNPLVKEKP